jgi:hypothetical protein
MEFKKKHLEQNCRPSLERGRAGDLIFLSGWASLRGVSEAVGFRGPAALLFYAAEKRNALDKWEALLKVAIAQATGANVTALRNRDSAGGKKR